jgi:hypothetical protein
VKQRVLRFPPQPRFLKERLLQRRIDFAGDNNAQIRRGNTMNIRTFVILPAAALLLGSISLAAAQSASPGASPQQGKCYDPVTKTVKNRTAMNSASPGTASPSGSKKPGDTMSGASPSGESSSTANSTTGSGAGATSRPSQAVGLPDC